MRRVKLFLIILCFIVALFVTLSYLALAQLNSLLAPVSSGLHYQVKEVEIPLHSSTARIAAILEEEGLIKNGVFFRLYARYKGYDQKLQAGRYRLDTNMSAEEILDKLQQGVVWEEGIRFTIPEGFTLEQIAAMLGEEGLVAREVFLEECRNYPRHENPAFPFLEAVPDGVKYLLEGYLFPDTFEVRQDITPREIIELMLRRFNDVFNEEFRLRAAELELTIHEVVTIASLVEKEARVPEERPLIAAVFHNRLQSSSMPLLQSCATVQYILGEVKPVLTNQDLEIDSPYNTYLYPHLPPGPIASPGADAIRAALYPAETDYLYFVSKEDGSGTHYFSTTLQEHNHYKDLVRRNR